MRTVTSLRNAGLALVLCAGLPVHAVLLSASVTNGHNSDAATLGLGRCGGGSGTWDIEAVAKVSTTDKDSKNGDKPALNELPMSEETRIVSDSGGALAVTVASAKAQIRFKSDPWGFCASGLHVSPAGSYARVSGTDKSPQGTASWRVNDPMFFDLDAEITSLHGFFAMDAGFGIQALGEGSSAHFHADGASNLAGYESLYTLDIRLDGAGGGPLVSFDSNPLLGLDDNAIVMLLGTALAAGFDAADHSFTLAGELLLFEYDLVDLPSSGTAILEIDQFAVARIGEPGGLALALLGLALLLRPRRRAPVSAAAA